MRGEAPANLDQVMDGAGCGWSLPPSERRESSLGNDLSKSEFSVVQDLCCVDGFGSALWVRKSPRQGGQLDPAGSSSETRARSGQDEVLPKDKCGPGSEPPQSLHPAS